MRQVKRILPLASERGKEGIAAGYDDGAVLIRELICSEVNIIFIKPKSCVSLHVPQLKR